MEEKKSTVKKVIFQCDGFRVQHYCTVDNALEDDILVAVKITMKEINKNVTRKNMSLYKRMFSGGQNDDNVDILHEEDYANMKVVIDDSNVENEVMVSITNTKHSFLIKRWIRKSIMKFYEMQEL